MFSSNFRKSVGFRLFRLFAIIVLLIAPAFAGAVIYYQTRQVTDNLAKEGKIIATLLTSNLRTWIYAENVEKLKDSLKDIMPHRNIASIIVCNAKGEILYQEYKSGQNSGVGSIDFSAVRFSKDDTGSFHVDEENRVITITCPVMMSTPGYDEELLYFEKPSSAVTEATIGYIQIGISKEALKKEAGRIIVRVAIVVLIGLCVGLVLLLLAIRRVTNPISELTMHVNRLGSGEPAAPIPVAGDDEVSMLAEAFNAMSVNLAKRAEEKSLLEVRLRKAQTMEAIGTLARGVAHDFNNILSTIQGSVFLMEKRFHDHQDLLRYSGEIQQSLSMAQLLINGLLTFSRTKAVVFYPVELNGLIENKRPMLANILGRDIKMRCDLHPEPLYVIGDALQLEQVVLNLVYNARDAMSEGGQLVIRTERIELREEERTGLFPKPGMYAGISVADSGHGMDEATSEKIFEPFFTTKDRGKGTGLGLAIVYGIIEQHRGVIEVITAPGKGTTFHIRIPLHECAPDGSGKTEQEQKQ